MARSWSRALRAAPLLLGLLQVACGGAAKLARTDATRFPPPPPDAITFWGHACCYIDVAGYGIVTDPVFDTKLQFRTRRVPAPPPADYAAARLILVSHAHDDHLSPSTIATFPAATIVLCPQPSARYLEGARQTIRPMRPGDVYEIPGGRVVAVAAHHPGTRRGVDAEADGRALGWVIETPEATLYYSGDTDLFEGFAAVARDYRPDLLILNINGHLHGLDAVRAARAADAKRVLPVHHGAYGYAFSGERKQPRDDALLRAHLGSTLVPLALGTSLPLRGLRIPPMH